MVLSAPLAVSARAGSLRPSHSPGSVPAATADVGDGRYGHASEQVAAADVVRAIHQLASHSNGISAEQAQAQFGIGSYKTAWLLLHKLRRAMVSPDRSLLQAMVETDETEVPLRSKHDPIKGYGIPNVGKLLIIGAVELSRTVTHAGAAGAVADRTGENVRGFVERVVALMRLWSATVWRAT